MDPEPRRMFGLSPHAYCSCFVLEGQDPGRSLRDEIFFFFGHTQF